MEFELTEKNLKASLPDEEFALHKRFARQGSNDWSAVNSYAIYP